MRLLLAEDEQGLSDALCAVLKHANYTVDAVYNGEDALDYLRTDQYDGAILDIMMPKMDGLTVLRRLRAKGNNIPVLMLTAKSEIDDRVTGLDCGANDYLTKPFDTKEVIARIKAVLRRTSGKAEVEEKVENKLKEVRYEKLVINLTNYELRVDGKQVDTPPKEMELIYHLASNPNRVFTRDQLLDEVWGFDYYGDSRTVDVHIKRLREKLEGISDKWELKTVWGVGYKFETKK